MRSQIVTGYLEILHIQTIKNMKHNYVFIFNDTTQNSYVGLGKSTIETTQDNALQN
jgi:hypothetical protein